MNTRRSLAVVFSLACGLGMIMLLIFGLRVEEVLAKTDEGVQPTPWFTIIYGHVFMPNGEPVPISNNSAGYYPKRRSRR